MEQLQLLIPFKISLNAIYSGVHWKKRSNIKEIYHKAVHVAVIQAKLPQIEQFPLNVIYSFTFKKNALDSSNCAFMAKMIEDSLVSCSVFPNDTPKYIQSVKYISQKGDIDSVSIFW